MEELLCEVCRERVVKEIARRGERGREELAYKEAVGLRRRAEELMRILEKKLF